MENSEDIKARLLPLSPLLGALEWILEHLPRQLIKVRLEANTQVKVVAEERGEFQAVGMSPGFALCVDPSEPKEGWYYLEAALVRNTGNREAAIQVDVRDGERRIIPIPTNLRGSIREVIRLPDRIESLHWFPTKALGYFSQSDLLLHRISPLESLLRRSFRVLHDCWRYRHDLANVFPGFSMMRFFTNLQDAYLHTAKIRIERQNGANYSTFIVRHDSLKPKDVSGIKQRIKEFRNKPEISILMVVRDDDAALLESSLGSLNSQLYSNWELIIFRTSTAGHDDSLDTTNSSNRDRIRVISIAAGKDACGDDANLLNQALHEARGEWVLRLVAGDRLPMHALFHLAAEIDEHCDAQFIYGDDDFYDIEQRFGPRFKPDWNPDLLTSCNYIGYPALYLRSRLLSIGGYNAGFPGAEDYELVLRYLKGVQDEQIRHVQKVLYHHQVNTTRLHDEETLHASGLKALELNLQEPGMEVTDGMASQLYRIHYRVPSPAPSVTIIIPNKNKTGLLRACIDSIFAKTDYPDWDILIVDNDSTQPDMLSYLDKLTAESLVKVLHYNEPFNFSAINNLAARHARGEILVLLNNDVEIISRDWLRELVSHAVRPGIGAVGAKLLYPNGTIQHAGVILGIGGVAAHVHRFLPGDAPGYCHRAMVTQNISAVTGACLAVRKALYFQVGGLDEVNLHVAYNDIDFCLKLLECGYRNIFTPYALLYHHESITRGADDTPEKIEIHEREYNHMRNKWSEVLASDHAYNSNLSCENVYFTPRI
ncbi:MAG: glycosyltransferase [Gammaproteobacteria bacterium]|nr:MAG: glycosyltransferase [Gammaproteobacteria bacterium]